MKRILLDSSVYGELVRDKKAVNKLVNLIPDRFVIYGNKIVRKELNKTPKKKTLKGRKLRILLLNLYDSLVRKSKHELKISDFHEVLAKEYYSIYKKVGGGKGKETIMNDFLIVSTATLFQLDVIVSHDVSSMLSNKAISAYKKVNAGHRLENPKFQKYKNFKKEVYLV